MVRPVFSWFRKKKPPHEKSPGGSNIIRHENRHESWKTRIGFTKESAEFAEARESVYERFFGKAASVFHEVIPLIPHIDVYTFDRGHNGRNFYTLVTGGMKNLEMSVPVDVRRKRWPDGAARRVELIFYCSEPKEEYLKTIKWLARFPHDWKTWIGPGHTLPTENIPAPLWGNPVLNTILFMPTIVRPDATLSDELTLAGEPVDFLWVVPLTTPECNLKLEKGSMRYSNCSHNITIRTCLIRTGRAMYSPTRAGLASRVASTVRFPVG